MLAAVTRLALALRYRITVRGLDRVAERGTRGILFLANHPALIDPVILLGLLHRRFRARPVGDREQADRPFVRWVARRTRAITIPDPATAGTAARAPVEAALEQSVAALEAGDNLLVYPSGHIYTSRSEDLRGNSGVHALLARAPDARVVLLTLHGLWGSRFSRAQTGEVPDLGRVLRHSARDLLAGGLLFLPRRRLTLDVEEPDDVPRSATREALNSYLEEHFNQGARPSTYVPYSLLERGGARSVADPAPAVAATGAEVSDGVRAAVLDRLREVTGVDAVDDDAHLARDLGCDSLIRAELIEWASADLAAARVDFDAVCSVRDLLRVAAGDRVERVRLRPVPARWFAGDRRGHDPSIPPGDTVVEVFLRRALTEPHTVILADQTSGVRTYRDLITGIFVLRPFIEALPGATVGLMMPASVAADVLFLAILCAGKVPVMVNWTVGPRQAAEGLELTATEVVLTARALIERLSAQGVSFAAFQDRFRYLEDVVAGVTTAAKARAAARARLVPRSVARVPLPDTAVILFTSGSEATPKAVPLSHRNLLTNLRDIAVRVPFARGDRLLSVLPPFHSFGLTAGVLMPLLNGIPCVHSPNPRDATMLATLVGAYHATLMGGTPTFLAAMVGSAVGDQLDTLRLAVTGGEACPDRVAEALAARCRNALVLEGYGITECSPIVAINAPDARTPGTIGRVLPSLDHVLLDPDSGDRCRPGRSGVLVVRGQSVFEGYLGQPEVSPFIDLDGHRWFDTGDVVSEDEDGFLTFRGRRRRFVKRGGEMISLPAIEAALAYHPEVAGAEGPVVAVIAEGTEPASELVLCTTLSLDRHTANRIIRDAGLSALHSVQRVETVAEIPVLGTGKTDYRRLADRHRSG